MDLVTEWWYAICFSLHAEDVHTVLNEKKFIWNIISFYDYHFFFQFELLFCLQDESDPALMVVKALMEKYPKVDAKIFIGKLLGPNR